MTRFYCEKRDLNDKDFYLFNERNYNLIDEISYFNNKSIYFQNKELDKASDHDVYESMRSTIKYLTSLINHHNGKQPYCVIINDITAFKDEHYEKLESLIKKLNNKNIFVIFQEQGFWQLTEQKENFINNIGNHIIMKTESMLVEKCLNIEILKTKKLQAGEFYCVKLNNTKINNNKVYKIEPIEIEVNDFECSYLNIP